MNPAEYGMYWTQFAPDRMLLDDSILSVGMSVMDDITHQTHSMVIDFCIVFTNMHIIIVKRPKYVHLHYTIKLECIFLFVL